MILRLIYIPETLFWSICGLVFETLTFPVLRLAPSSTSSSQHFCIFDLIFSNNSFPKGNVYLFHQSCSVQQYLSLLFILAPTLDAFPRNPCGCSSGSLAPSTHLPFTFEPSPFPTPLSTHGRISHLAKTKSRGTASRLFIRSCTPTSSHFCRASSCPTSPPSPTITPMFWPSDTGYLNTKTTCAVFFKFFICLQIYSLFILTPSPLLRLVNT